MHKLNLMQILLQKMPGKKKSPGKKLLKKMKLKLSLNVKLIKSTLARSEAKLKNH